MNFKDFKNDYSELIGQYVLYEYGKTYNTKNPQAIRKIIKITKTGFKINDNNALFDFDGRQKGLNSRMNIGTVSICKLLTNEEAIQISNQWKLNKEIKIKKLEIENKLKECNDITKINKLLEIL